MKFVREKDFSDHVVDALADLGFDVEPEKNVGNGSRRRCDAVATKSDMVYALEMKATNRTSRSDQCLGQVLVCANVFSAIPVCVFPSDCMPDPLFTKVCGDMGVIVVNEKTIGDIEKRT